MLNAAVSVYSQVISEDSPSGPELWSWIGKTIVFRVSFTPSGLESKMTAVKGVWHNTEQIKKLLYIISKSSIYNVATF